MSRRTQTPRQRRLVQCSCARWTCWTLQRAQRCGTDPNKRLSHVCRKIRIAFAVYICADMRSRRASVPEGIVKQAARTTAASKLVAFQCRLATQLTTSPGACHLRDSVEDCLGATARFRVEDHGGEQAASAHNQGEGVAWKKCGTESEGTTHRQIDRGPLLALEVSSFAGSLRA